MASSHTSTMARVVVGVDGSAHSKLALLAAVDLAAAAGVRVHVVEAWQRASVAGADAPTALGVRRDLMATVKETLGPNYPPDTQMSVIEGDPVDVLVHASVGALNLVVGAHDHTTAAHRSVTDDIVDNAACPVTVVSGAALTA